MAPTPVWFITGAGTGFGNAISFEALKRGHKVVATARKLAGLARLKEAGADVMEFDVNSAEAVIIDKVRQAKELYGRIDHVVSAAGYGIVGACEEASEQEVYDQFNTNVFGALKLVKAVTPILRAQKSGTIANFGSVVSWQGTPGTSLYAATKWAMSGFSESMTAELAPFGISVVSIEPGYFRTAMLVPGKRLFTAKRLADEYKGTPAEAARDMLDQADGNQPGNVFKGATMIVDVLTGTGASKGRPVPLRLVLGKQAMQDVRDKCNSTLELLKKWEDVGSATEYDE